MVFITAKFWIKPEDADRWPQIAGPFTEATRAEPGCLWSDWSRSLDDPTECVLVGAFRDGDAGAAHVGSAHFRQAQQDLPPHLVATPKIISQSVEQDDRSELGEMAVAQAPGIRSAAYPMAPGTFVTHSEGTATHGRYAMTDEAKLRRQLRTRIQARRADIEVFLEHARPRRNILTNVTIVCSALAAAFTAGPAVAGPAGVGAVAAGMGVKPAAVWQPLCIAAFVVAVLAAIAANLHRTHDLPAQVTAAETCSMELENLLTSLEFRDLPVTEAVELYQQYNSHIPFVHERAPQPKAAPAH